MKVALAQYSPITFLLIKYYVSCINKDINYG